MSEEAQNTLDAVKEEVKSAISSRFNSPFAGAFIISWLAWNHRLIFVLFSGMTVDQRFHYIDERLYPTWLEFSIFNFLGPLLSALVYIFLLPWPAKWVHRWNLKMKRDIREVELESSGEEVLTLPATKNIHEKIASQKKTINDLAERERVARVCGLGWRAMARFGSDMDANHKESALFEFLTSASFDVRSDARATGVTGTLALDSQGNASLVSAFIVGSRSIHSWTMMGSEVLLKGSNGAEIGRLVFRPELGGALKGQIGNDPVFVSSKELKSWD
ncbi:hypothetical protein D3C81_451560 [compost metagenome]